jgi:hypothetical protein
MSTTPIAKQTATESTGASVQSTVYSVGIVSNAGSPIASGKLVVNLNSDGSATGLLNLNGGLPIPLDNGQSKSVPALWPTTVISLFGSGASGSCNLVLEKVFTPNVEPILCGVVLLVQNGATTQGIMLIQLA